VVSTNARIRFVRTIPNFYGGGGKMAIFGKFSTKFPFGCLLFHNWKKYAKLKR